MVMRNFLTPEDLQIMLDETYGNQQTQDFIRPNPLQFQYPYIPGGIMNTGSVMYDEFPQAPSQKFQFLPEAYNQSEDVEQVESLTETKPSGIAKLLQYLPFGEKSLTGALAQMLLPKESPEIRSMKNFYRQNYGLTDTGQVASGIMQGYNPVYGGFLNMITGGRYGKPTQFGLARAARQRIENIAKRRAPQTESSLAKIRELQRFAEADTISRARQAAPDVYSRAERAGTLGPGGGFSTSGREGAFESKSPRGRQDF